MSSADVDAYLAALPDARRAALEEIRAAIRSVAPEAEEVITYKMPGFRLDGRFFVSYDAFTAHYSLFPASEAVVALGAEVAPDLHGKGTLRFPADRPIPAGLIRRIVGARRGEPGGAR